MKSLQDSGGESGTVRGLLCWRWNVIRIGQPFTFAVVLIQGGSRTSASLWDYFFDPSNLIATVSALAAVISALIAMFALWPIWVQWRVNRLLSRSFGSDFYSAEVLERSTRYYVPPNCTSIDPSFESEMRNLVVTEEKLFAVLDRFLDKESSHRHLLLLADSGMGKSSCLLNYYVRNQSRPIRKRKRISVVPLGIPKADQDIQAIENKRNTILFLDAFDEDTKAIQDHKERLRQLMDLAGEFKRVLITCRTQFFLRDEEIPRETGVVRIEPRRAGEKGVYEFQKLYLSPLNDSQVDRFLRKRYPVWHWRKRRGAWALVHSVPLLSVRPMLLAYIPDLLDSGASIRYSFELYEALVNSWIARESRWVEKEKLREFSEYLAVDLYVNRENRGAEQVSASDLSDLAELWGIPFESWQLTGRSLLNRDAAGNYKFAHRSIMEYLFVCRYLAGDSTTVQVKWTDQMAAFLAEIIGGRRWEGLNLNMSDAFRRSRLLRVSLWGRLVRGKLLEEGIVRGAILNVECDISYGGSIPMTLASIEYKFIIGGREIKGEFYCDRILNPYKDNSLNFELGLDEAARMEIEQKRRRRRLTMELNLELVSFWGETRLLYVPVLYVLGERSE